MMEELYQAINERPWMSVEVIIEDGSKRVKYTDNHLAVKEHIFYWFSLEYTDHEVLTDIGVVEKLSHLSGLKLVTKWAIP